MRAGGVDATFVVGSDKLAQLADASFYADGERGVSATFEECRFLVVPREGSPVSRDDVRVLNITKHSHATTIAHISATEVRRRIRSRKPIEHLVPPEVALAVGGYTSAT